MHTLFFFLFLPLKYSSKFMDLVQKRMIDILLMAEIALEAVGLWQGACDNGLQLSPSAHRGKTTLAQKGVLPSKGLSVNLFYL